MKIYSTDKSNLPIIRKMFNGYIKCIEEDAAIIINAGIKLKEESNKKDHEKNNIIT